MSSISEETQERIERLARPEFFSVRIDTMPVLTISLSNEELDRLKPKIEMVIKSAQRLCAGMVKGTIKYPSDNHALSMWLSHLIDESVDQVNYTSFMEEAVEKSSK